MSRWQRWEFWRSVILFAERKMRTMMVPDNTSDATPAPAERTDYVGSMTVTMDDECRVPRDAADVLRGQYEALLEKHQEVLDTVQQCACAYDGPQDVCIGHEKEMAGLRERVRELEECLHKMIGVPASAGFCEPIEGYVKRPHDAVCAMRDMAARLRGGSDE